MKDLSPRPLSCVALYRSLGFPDIPPPMPQVANKHQKPDIPGSGGDPCQLTDDSLIVRSLEIIPEGVRGDEGGPGGSGQGVLWPSASHHP